MAEKDNQLAIFTLVKALVSEDTCVQQHSSGKAYIQELPCQLDSLIEGALHLSEAILGDNDYRDQHTDVMEHILNLVQMMGNMHTSNSPMLNRAIHLLKARSEKHVCW